jgi:rhodanese-related sulfurtransferase
MKTISPKEAFEKYQNAKARLIDVRTPIEYRTVHAAGAEAHEIGRLDPDYINQEDFIKDKEREMIFLCARGVRARRAAEKFEAHGFGNVYVVEGGTDSWLASNLPVEKGEVAIGLERQVRIAAGGLVFLGSLFGIFVSPYFLIIPVFIGGGLVSSGITKTCGMAMLLAKMPWNK